MLNCDALVYSKQAEIAVNYYISPGTLNEWLLLFIDGKLETEEQKPLEIELLKKTRFSGIGVEDQMSFVFLTKVVIMVNESIE